MPLEWTDSSARHGIAREDALYAIAHAVGSAELEGRSGETTMVHVGHPHGQTDRYIEVIVAQRHPRTMVVFHVMELSDQYRHLVSEGE
ncbi:hypothetical protein [Cellulomonas hominis]